MPTKVRLLHRKGDNKERSIVEYDDGSAQWLIANGYAIPVEQDQQKTEPEKPKREETPAAPAPRRGRPPKNAR